jgi:septal ring factor EnvC (AmiA/AmiB activator)
MADTDTPLACRKHPSSDCIQADQVDRIDRRVERLERRVGEGNVEFAELRKDISSLTLAIADLKALVDKVLEAALAPSPFAAQIKAALLSWSVPAAIISILWLLAHSGQIPGVKP